jgi:hypothetical protein
MSVRLRASTRSISQSAFSSTSTRRVGIDPEGQFIVLDEPHPGQEIYHGHVRLWDQLTQAMRNALRDAGLVNDRGKPRP